MSKSNKGLVLLYTGVGEGMTAAALGQAFRSLGRGLAVCFIRFMSEAWTREAFVPPGIAADRMEFQALGQGLSWKRDQRDADRERVRAAWDIACGKITSGRFDLVVLDEVTEVLVRGLLSEREVVQGLAGRPGGVNVIITGRDAPDALIAAADLVTEVRELRRG